MECDISHLSHTYAQLHCFRFSVNCEVDMQAWSTTGCSEETWQRTPQKGTRQACGQEKEVRVVGSATALLVAM